MLRPVCVRGEAVGEAGQPSDSETLASASAPAIAGGDGGMAFEALRGLSVQSANDSGDRAITDLWASGSDATCVLVFVTHFADLTTWEYVEGLREVLPRLEAAGVEVAVVGLGSGRQAQMFADTVGGFPLSRLFGDPEGRAYEALGFSKGLAVAGFPPTARLLAMLAGVGSKGTIQEVLRGYVGDRSAKPVWPGSTPFDVLGGGYQRPFELATLRLFNMAGIATPGVWKRLAPEDDEKLLWQGGTLVFKGTQCTFRHADAGILGHPRLPLVLAQVGVPDVE